MTPKFSEKKEKMNENKSQSSKVLMSLKSLTVESEIALGFVFFCSFSKYCTLWSWAEFGGMSTPRGKIRALCYHTPVCIQKISESKTLQIKITHTFHDIS